MACDCNALVFLHAQAAPQPCTSAGCVKSRVVIAGTDAGCAFRESRVDKVRGMLELKTERVSSLGVIVSWLHAGGAEWRLWHGRNTNVH